MMTYVASVARFGETTSETASWVPITLAEYQLIRKLLDRPPSDVRLTDISNADEFIRDTSKYMIDVTELG